MSNIYVDTKLNLGDGVEVRYRTVPPHVYMQFERMSRKGMELPPVPPKVTLTAKATGHTEEVEALPDTPEYDAFMVEYEAWAQRNAVKEGDRQAKWNTLLCNLGIIAWRLYPISGHFRGIRHFFCRLFNKGWVSDVPEDWVYPQVLVDVGLEAGDNPRMDYIGIEVIRTPVALSKILMSVMTITDIEDGEVEAAYGGFQAS